MHAPQADGGGGAAQAPHRTARGRLLCRATLRDAVPRQVWLHEAPKGRRLDEALAPLLLRGLSVADEQRLRSFVHTPTAASSG